MSARALLRRCAQPLLQPARRAARTALRPVIEDVAALKSYTPILLSTIASQNAAERELRGRLGELQQRLDGTHSQLVAAEARLEFVRKEIMFEMRYGGAGTSGDGLREPRILNHDRLAEANGRLRLNLGCGHIPLEGYVNVDSRELPGVDVVADISHLPFAPSEVSEIYSAHLLEHFPEQQLIRQLLPHWLALLRPGGRLVVVVPDADTMLAEHAAGRLTFEELREVTFGGQEYEGDHHFTMFSQESMLRLLEHAGFSEVAVVEAARRNGVCYEMEVSARKPGAGETPPADG